MTTRTPLIFARLAGFTYLLTFAIVVFVNFGIHERLIVSGNVAETAQNIVASEQLWRIGIFLDLIYSVGIIALLLALYAILKPINQNLALLAAFLRLVYALTWVLITLNLFDVQRVLSGTDYLQVFEADQLQAFMRQTLDACTDMYYVGLVFWALASTVCSYLLFKSRFIPSGLAAFGVISSAWCALCTFAFILSPNFAKIVDLSWFDVPMVIFELVLGIWLLVKGLRPSGIAE
ncbi:MAG: DUF4386 domain-containing protein [Anaerolineales bacterium]|nr:DUF4386 domain-containing protein [Anaerolineales bacterium]